MPAAAVVHICTVPPRAGPRRLFTASPRTALLAVRGTVLRAGQGATWLAFPPVMFRPSMLSLPASEPSAARTFLALAFHVLAISLGLLLRVSFIASGLGLLGAWMGGLAWAAAWFPYGYTLAAVGAAPPRPRRHPRVVARGGACRKPLPGDGRRVRRGFQPGVPRGGRGAGGLPQTGAPLRHRAARAPGRLTRASSPSPGEGTRPARRRRPAARHPPGAAPAEPAAPASTHVPGPRRAPGTTRPRAVPPRSGWR